MELKNWSGGPAGDGGLGATPASRRRRGDREATAVSNDHPAQQVTLYTQAGCAESAKVRSWLADHGITFTERDASGDPDAARALNATGTFATPLLVVGEEKVLGFRPREMSVILPDQSNP